MLDDVSNFEDGQKEPDQLGRKAYEAPRLISLGPVQALVLAGCCGNGDADSNSIGS